jgi:uncharacterized protein (DUF697 family)
MDPKKVFDQAGKQLKDAFMSDKTDKDKHASTVVRNHVIWSMGAGMIPVLVADVFAVSAIQLDMIRQLCKVYEVDFSETRGKAIVTSLTSSTLARIGTGSVVKLIPGVGSILGGVTVSVFAGASTYALGEVFKKHFASGGTILDFDPARLKKIYDEKFEKGKKIVKEWKKEQEEVEKTMKQEAPEEKPQAAAFDVEARAKEIEKDIVQRLKELADLKKEGIISEEEFEQMKQKIIGEM